MAYTDLTGDEAANTINTLITNLRKATIYTGDTATREALTASQVAEGTIYFDTDLQTLMYVSDIDGATVTWALLGGKSQSLDESILVNGSVHDWTSRTVTTLPFGNCRVILQVYMYCKAYGAGFYANSHFRKNGTNPIYCPSLSFNYTADDLSGVMSQTGMIIVPVDEDKKFESKFAASSGGVISIYAVGYMM